MIKHLFHIKKNTVINALILFGISLLVYSQLMTNQLVNHYDGLWEGSFHNAGAWELSIGRWFWLYLSRLRFGVAPDPATSMISLALFVVGLLLFFDLMKVEKRSVLLLTGSFFLCTPAVCSNLSYRYMSPTFATAFLLSIAAVWAVEKGKKPWIAIGGGAILVMLSMGAYQAFIGCTCVAVLACLMKKLEDGAEWKKVLLWFAKAACAIVAGGVLYILALRVHQAVFHVNMSDYMGGSEYSVLNSIKHFGNSLAGSYQIWWLFIKGGFYKANIFQNYMIYIVVTALLFLGLLYNTVRIAHKNRLSGSIYLLAVVLLPAASVAVKFIATDASLSIQMTAGLFLLYAAVFCSLQFEGEKWYEKAGNAILILVLAVTVYGGFYQVTVDQNTMYEGRTSTISLTEMAIDKMVQMDYLSTDYTYCFYGTPAGSSLYTMDKGTQYANFYAMFGAWYTNGESAKSWKGLINDVMGVQLKMVTPWEYNAIGVMEEVQQMPVFPSPGSILKIDNTIIVRIS